jgi:hypothetical protein
VKEKEKECEYCEENEREKSGRKYKEKAQRQFTKK